jgi:hypothetical protein
LMPVGKRGLMGKVVPPVVVVSRFKCRTEQS